MRNLFKTRRRKVVALAAVSALTVAAVAFAFLSSTGSGSGTGNVSSSNPTLALFTSGSSSDRDAAVTWTQLSQAKTVYVWAYINNSSPNPAHVNGSTLKARGNADDSSGTCPADSFTPGTATATTSDLSGSNEVPASSNTHATATLIGHLDVTFADTNSNQDSCLTETAPAVFTAASN